MSHLQRLVLVIVLFASSACSQKPVEPFGTTVSAPAASTPNVNGTQAATSTPKFLPTFVLPILASPTPLPPPGRESQVPWELTFDQINPIFYGNSLLGATFGGNWLYPREVYSLLGSPQVYEFYDQNFQPFQATVVVSEPPPGGAGRCDLLGIKFVDQGPGDAAPVLGVKPGQSVVFRPVEVMVPDSELYEGYLQEWLVLQGVQSPELGIKNILRVDLEGDGVDEMILVATNIEDSMGGLHVAGAGKYSVVLMRKVIGAQVYTVPLVADIYYTSMNYPIIYDVDHIYDLNGDGKLEIILSGHWWEGGGLFVYEVHDLNASKVLHLSCGLISR